MKSPFTGGQVVLKQEKSELTFRKEKFQFIHQYYECVDTKEHFTTTELDEVNIMQVYNQYRVKYGIPFTEEIKRVRENYGLSAAKMSVILGFGDNQYRLYENGAMPSETNGKILGSIKNPEVFKSFVSENQFDSKEYEKICAKLKKASEEYNDRADRERFIFGQVPRGKYNGYAEQSYNRIKNLLLYYISACHEVYVTKMNKLLFYTDFLSYQKRGCGISGLGYEAIQRGMVPVRWDRVFSMVDELQQIPVNFPSGISGIKLCSKQQPDLTGFSEADLTILNTVKDKFGECSAALLSDESHKEGIWERNHDTGNYIDYDEAFSLKAFT